MDILYIIGGRGSDCDNFELRCSLRSLEKYGQNIDRVFVAGNPPSWLSNSIVKVPYTQPFTSNGVIPKNLNILATVIYVAEHTDIGDEFLVSMDDHFYIKPTDFNNYPFYVKLHGDGGNDIDLPERNYLKSYRDLLVRTRKECIAQKLTYHHFTLHRNMHVSRKVIQENKAFFNEIFKQRRGLEGFAYMNNYRLCKHKDFTPTPVLDLKIRDAGEWKRVEERDSEVFSTYNFNKDSDLYKLLLNLYPEKSKYEK